ncbi:MAG: hypothetical protein EBV03_08920, partial [Proteobacteria bacterium]|nr:hypothetical protein [Pseudomonadota bacterium]
ALFPPGLFGLARFSVPDVLAACLALYAYHALLLRGKLGIGFALALLSVLARTDMLPLCILLLAAYGCRFGRVAAILACCALSCAVVLCVLHAAHYYGLAVHLEYHFIHKSPDVALLKGDIRLIDYLDLLLRSIAEALKNPGVLLLALWTLVVMARTRQVPDGLFIAWLYMAAKLVIFPEWEERYILICYLMAFSSGAALLSRKEKHDQYS